MDCIDVLVRLEALVAGRLSGVELEAVRQHLRDCPSCMAAAMGRLHTGRERSLWEALGMAAGEPVLGRAKVRRIRPAGDRAERSGIVARLLQISAVILFCALCIGFAVTYGRLPQVLGFERWHPEPASEPEPEIAAPEEPAGDGARDLFAEVRELLDVIMFADAAGAEVSERISETCLIIRLREQRDRSDLPAWATHVCARLETFFLRAAAAGENREEWDDLKTIAAREQLARAAEDTGRYLTSPERHDEP